VAELFLSSVTILPAETQAEQILQTTGHSEERKNEKFAKTKKKICFFGIARPPSVSCVRFSPHRACCEAGRDNSPWLGSPWAPEACDGIPASSAGFMTEFILFACGLAREATIMRRESLGLAKVVS
jgi:hypothetical protein